MICYIHYCRVRVEKILLVWIAYALGKIIYANLENSKGNRKPGNFIAREQYVLN